MTHHSKGLLRSCVIQHPPILVSTSWGSSYQVPFGEVVCMDKSQTQQTKIRHVRYLVQNLILQITVYLKNSSLDILSKLTHLHAIPDVWFTCFEHKERFFINLRPCIGANFSENLMHPSWKPSLTQSSYYIVLFNKIVNICEWDYGKNW